MAMRRSVFYLFAMAMIVIFASCGSSNNPVSNKPATHTAEGDLILGVEPCEAYAMEQPGKRGWGVGTHFKEATARNVAELGARTQLARALQSCIETGTQSFGNDLQKYAGSDNEGMSVTDQSGSTKDRESGLAKELIKGAVVVKTTRYKTPNNQYKIYVCVEYSEGVPEMAGKIAKAFNEKLTDEQKARVKFDDKKFTEAMEESMRDYKGITQQ